MARILVADDERSMREFLEIFLGKEGHEVVVADSAPSAIAVAAEQPPDLVITDLRLGRGSGLDVLEQVKRDHPDVEVVVITAFGTIENAIQAMQLGAYQYVQKPFKVGEMAAVVAKALEKRALVAENRALRSRLERRDRCGDIVGHSAAMAEVFNVIEKVAPTRTTVLVAGESGVGKELVARALHARSPRASAPFVAVNCGAIPEGLLESELFGHVRGAFTGAQSAKTGLFQTASGGTLFLDEVGELPLALQVKLLRALQERRVKPVGSIEDVEVDARIIAATNRDLAAEVKAGKFREDLFYRLDVIRIKVPPLRERREDILLLAEHFLRRFAEEHGRPKMTFSRAALSRLADHSFPGNVRELENIVERAVTLCEGSVVGEEDLPASLRGTLPPPPPEADERVPVGFDLQRHLDELERTYLNKALAQSGGVKQDAAKLLGISFRSFRYRLKKFQDPGAAEPESAEDDLSEDAG